MSQLEDDLLEGRGLIPGKSDLFNDLLKFANSADRPRVEKDKKFELNDWDPDISGNANPKKRRRIFREGVQYSIERRSKVLKALEDWPEGCRLAKLMKETGIPKNSLIDLLEFLLIGGIIEKVAVSNHWYFRLTRRLAEQDPQKTYPSVFKRVADWRSGGRKKPFSRELARDIRILVEMENLETVAKKLNFNVQLLSKLLKNSDGDPSEGEAVGDFSFYRSSGIVQNLKGFGKEPKVGFIWGKSLEVKKYPVQADIPNDIISLQQKLDEWRGSRSHPHQRIPQAFYGPVTAAVKIYGRTKVSKYLGLNFRTLDSLEKRYLNLREGTVFFISGESHPGEDQTLSGMAA